MSSASRQQCLQISRLHHDRCVSVTRFHSAGRVEWPYARHRWYPPPCTQTVSGWVVSSVAPDVPGRMLQPPGSTGNSNAGQKFTRSYGTAPLHLLYTKTYIRCVTNCCVTKKLNKFLGLRWVKAIQFTLFTLPYFHNKGEKNVNFFLNTGK